MRAKWIYVKENGEPREAVGQVRDPLGLLLQEGLPRGRVKHGFGGAEDNCFRSLRGEMPVPRASGAGDIPRV